MVYWRSIALHKLLGDGLYHAVEWIGRQLYQRLLKVFCERGMTASLRWLNVVLEEDCIAQVT